MTEILNIATQFGAFVFLAAMMMFIGKPFVERLMAQNEQMARALENNTAAMTSLQALEQRTCDQLSRHDGRVDDMQPKIDDIKATVIRVETKVDDIHHAVVNRPKTDTQRPA